MFRPRDHLRDKGDPHPGGNERLHRLDVAAFKDDMGLETGFFAKFQGDFAETLSFFQKDERFVFELLERDRSLRFGQRMMGLEWRTWFGGKVSPLVAAFHALLFWFSFVVFFPILLWCLFDPQKRCLHDIFAGMVAINRR